jgi:hypothetical protein
MNGVIQGGWEFVAAAYLVSAAVLGTYAVSVLWRLKAELLIESGKAAVKALK